MLYVGVVSEVRLVSKGQRELMDHNLVDSGLERSLNAAQAAAEGVLETASGKASGFGPSGFLCAYGFDRGLAHECEEESTKTQDFRKARRFCGWMV